MPVGLPLALIGLGLIVYFLFASATYALPLLVGLSVGSCAAAMGASTPTSLAIGILAWLAAIATGRFAALTVSSRFARISIQMLFAIPAAVAGFSVAAGFAALGGFAAAGSILAPVAALACAAVAARRVSQAA